MALKAILNQQTDYTGEFPVEYAKSGLWRFNEADPDENDELLDSSGCGRNFAIINWSGTTASMSKSSWGRQFRFNINNPLRKRPTCRSPMTAASLQTSVNALWWVAG